MLYEPEPINTVVCSRCLQESLYEQWIEGELLCPHCWQPPEVQLNLRPLEVLEAN